MEYISVAFDENNYVKTLASKFDWLKKSWYIPQNIDKMNKVKLQEKYKSINIYSNVLKEKYYKM